LDESFAQLEEDSLNGLQDAEVMKRNAPKREKNPAQREWTREQKERAGKRPH